MKNTRRIIITLSIMVGLSVAQAVKVVAPDERQLKTRFNQAQRFEREGQLDAAAELYKFVVDAQPANASYYEAYVRLLFSRQNLPELERVITRFGQLNPKDEDAAVDLGKYYFMRGDSARAFREWQQAVAKFNHSLSFYRTLFNGLISLRLYDDAERLILQAREHYKQADLMALELANYQVIRGNYLQAAKEYLVYGRANPRSYEMISGQILRFPTDSLLCMRLDSLLQTESNLNPGSADLHRLRADLLFKYECYDAALEEIFQVENLSGNRGEPALNMARSLVQIKRYELAQQFYAKILARRELQAAAPQALLGLAEAFEKSVLAEDVAEPLHYLYPGNLFFNTEFAQQVAPNSADLQRAFAIYDSLIANQPRGDLSSQALYHLADLRFRVVRDFDGAQNLYRKALQTTRDRELILACQKRIGEVLIARGDPLAAEKHFRTEAGRREGTNEEKVLQTYFVLAQFLAQDFDSLGVELSNLMPLLGPQHPLFNDVMEFDDFFKANFSETDESGKKAFGELARAELLLHQNKLSEAEQVYTFLIQKYPAAPSIKAAGFRLIQINLEFGRRADAAALAEPFFSRENELADQVAFMLAEVADRRVHDWQQAARYYEIVLEKYPNSLLVDPARKRLRELQQKTAAKES